MNKTELIAIIANAKQTKQLSWEGIAAAIGMSPVWTTSACLGMNSTSAEIAETLCTVLGLPTEAKAAFMECPTKTWGETIPQDPLIYRLYEMIGVYGPTIKALIHEKFGDGIMSAIDFSMDIAKEENPKGDRVIIHLNGKFLPYKSW